MNNKTLNFCQISLARDIPIILQNYKSLKNFYKDIKINIICPKSELNIFRRNLNFNEFISNFLLQLVQLIIIISYIADSQKNNLF